MSFSSFLSDRVLPLITRLKRALSSLIYGARLIGLSLIALGTSSSRERLWGLGLVNPTRELAIGLASLELGRVLATLLASDRVTVYNNSTRIRLIASGSIPTLLAYSSALREIVISLLAKVGISLDITVSGPFSSV